MVTKIATPHRLLDAMNYNEQKVLKGKAECIYAGNYLSDAKQMNFYQKLAGLENRNVLNDRAVTKTIHVSLNFDPSERLSKDTLTEIANEYMNILGFAEQPFLVYQHHDAGHPHLHIVSTTIKEDGSRINTHNIGKIASEKARKEIEQQFHLIRAETQKHISVRNVAPVDVAKVIYGKVETKRSISNVVNAVVNSYKFTSLPELNAALKQYNVLADRGTEEGRIYKNRGLVYRILDENENKIGVPIKASSVAGKPTLDMLERKFALNEQNREPLKQPLATSIDEVFAKSPTTMREFIAALVKKQIYTVLRKNEEGGIYGITFVDNQSKCVFNGSDLGKKFSAAAIQNRLCAIEKLLSEKEVHNEKSVSASSTDQTKNLHYQEHKQPSLTNSSKEQGLLESLLSPERQFDSLPSHSFKMKKRKKRNHHL